MPTVLPACLQVSGGLKGNVIRIAAARGAARNRLPTEVVGAKGRQAIVVWPAHGRAHGWEASPTPILCAV
jgi:hypothetical protein